MKFLSFKVAAPVVALGFLLSGCGGGDDEGIIVNENEPSSTGVSASVATSAATNALLNGSYSSNNILLNNVTKVNPVGEQETCRFRFAGLVQQGSSRVMDGDVRYIPANPDLLVTFMSISTIQFVLTGTAGATVDRTNNRVVYTNAVFKSADAANPETITLTGAIPMRGDRPGGC